MKQIKDKGITLVETIVVIGIICIMLLPLYNIMGMNNQLVKRTEHLANAKSIAANIFQYIENELKYANVVIIGSSSESALLADPLVATSSMPAYALYMMPDSFRHYIATSSLEKVVFDQHYLGKYSIDLDYQLIVDPATATTYNDRLGVKVIVGLPSGGQYVLGPNHIKVENMNPTVRTGDRVMESTTYVGHTVVSYLKP